MNQKKFYARIKSKLPSLHHFIANFTNLQELVFSIWNCAYEYIKPLEYVTLPRLRTLKFNRGSFISEYSNEFLEKFLEINGKNLEEIFLRYGDDSSNLTIAKFCLNLKSLCTHFKNDEVETLRMILNGCQRLERIAVSCGDGDDLNELLKIITKDSPKEFYELKIRILTGKFSQKEILSIELEPIFKSWSNRQPQKSLSLIIFNPYALEVDKRSLDVVERFRNLGVVKRFEIFNYYF